MGLNVAQWSLALMKFLFLLLFIGVPIAEIAAFIEVGGLIGLWPTLAVIVLTAVIGTALLRRQGLKVIEQAQIALSQGGRRYLRLWMACFC